MMAAASVSMTTMAASPSDLLDPTRPLDYRIQGQAVQSGLVLTSVLVTQTSRQAVINGEHVVENQKIGDAEIISIQPGRVIVRRGDRSEELKVHHNDVKHMANENKLDL